MYFNSFEAQLLAESRMKDAIHQAEQAHLVRVVKSSERLQGWRLSIILALKSLLALVIRPQRKRLTVNTPNL